MLSDLFHALLNVQKDAACAVHQQIYNMFLVCLMRSEAQDLTHSLLFITQECVESLEEMIKAHIFVEYHCSVLWKWNDFGLLVGEDKPIVPSQTCTSKIGSGQKIVTLVAFLATGNILTLEPCFNTRLLFLNMK